VRESLELHSKTTAAAATFLDLPLEILAVIIEKVFKQWTRATVVMRVSKQLRTITNDVKQRLEMNVYVWWTGSADPMVFGDPIEADKIEGLSTMRNSDLQLMGVMGAGVEDVQKLMRHGWWLNNFVIALAMVASMPSSEHILGISPETSTAVHSTLFIAPGLMHVLGGGFQSPRLWHSAALLSALCCADVLLIPMNMDNDHWIPVRVSRHSNIVEAFMLMQSAHEKDRASLYIIALVKYLVDAHFLTPSARVRLHASRAWKQQDGSSCGLLTLIILLSLQKGQRLSINPKDDPMCWRAHFAQVITAATHHRSSVV
jgi:hypothetical protein